MQKLPAKKIKRYIYCIRNTEMEKCSAIYYSSGLYYRENELFVPVGSLASQVVKQIL